MGSRQREDEADFTFLTPERQRPAVRLDDLLGHARADVEQNRAVEDAKRRISEPLRQRGRHRRDAGLR